MFREQNTGILWNFGMFWVKIENLPFRNFAGVELIYFHSWLFFLISETFESIRETVF
jgi:hypothetical protein